jgi:hypothetical protein
MLSFSSVEDVIIFHGVNVTFFEGLDVIIFKCRGYYHFYCVNVIIFEFLDAIFLIVEDVCKRENDNIKMIIFADREKKNENIK